MQDPLMEAIGDSALIGTTFWFVIDTNRYAGNFERDMCANVTGRYGDCEVGKEVAERVLSEVGGALDWTEEAICKTQDEHGVARPVRMEQTPRWVQDHDGNHYPQDQVPAGIVPFQWAYQSVAISFERTLSEAELLQLMDRAEAFPHDESYLRRYKDTPLAVIGYRVIEEQTMQTCRVVYGPRRQ